MAQSPLPASNAERTRFGGHAGLVVYGTGDATNCPTGIGAAVGLDVRRPGPWLLAGNADLMIASPPFCTDQQALAMHEGEFVGVLSQVLLYPALRVGVRAGRAFQSGGTSIEPGLAAGLLNGKASLAPRDARTWKPWAAGSLAVRPEGWPVRVRAEYGWHAVPVQHVRDEGRVVREFHRWKPLFLLMAVF